MAENDSLSSFTGIENDSMLTNLVYSSSKVTKDDALSVASLSGLFNHITSSQNAQ